MLIHFINEEGERTKDDEYFECPISMSLSEVFKNCGNSAIRVCFSSLSTEEDLKCRFCNPDIP